jgi:hypothetical protein
MGKPLGKVQQENEEDGRTLLRWILGRYVVGIGSKWNKYSEAHCIFSRFIYYGTKCILQNEG